jgi:putative dimethyl sulfoxide reductase chaperone
VSARGGPEVSAGRQDQVRAALLLARWWSRPTTDEVEGWAELWPAATVTASALELDADAVEELSDALARSDPGTLLDEYERLLNGPGRPPCPPYESLWRADLPAQEHETLMSSAADAVQTIYRTLGLKLRANPRELPDHLLVEWEALAYTLDRGATDASEALLADHLTHWMAPFCHAVSEATTERFYTRLAALTPVWTAGLAG